MRNKKGTPLACGEGNTENRIRHIIRYRKPLTVAAAVAVVVLSILVVCLLTGGPAENGNSAFSEGDSVQSSATQEENRSSGENSPDSVNSRFPEPVELPSGHIVAVTGDGYDITISIDGEAYRMEDLCDAVNALVDIREFGGYIVVTGHVSPDHSYFGLYSTGSGQWAAEYVGSLLTWDEDWMALENPIESVVYAESAGNQGAIYDWKTDRIAAFDLEEESIYDLKREGDNITITIVSYEGESRELHYISSDK